MHLSVKRFDKFGINCWNTPHICSWKTRACLSFLVQYTAAHGVDLFPDTQNRGLRVRRGYRERFPHHRLQRKPLVSDPGIHHDMPWCITVRAVMQVGIINSPWWEKRSRHSRRMRNPQFCLSVATVSVTLTHIYFGRMFWLLQYKYRELSI